MITRETFIITFFAGALAGEKYNTFVNITQVADKVWKWVRISRNDLKNKNERKIRNEPIFPVQSKHIETGFKKNS